jgi:hypothetical protein
MSKNTINRPGLPKPARPRDADGGPSPQQEGGSPSLKGSSLKKADKKKAPAGLQRPQRPQRPRGAHGAGHAPGAHGAEAHDEEGGQGALGAIEAAGGADELNRRHSAEVEHLEEEDEVEQGDDAHETAATGVDSIKRSKGGDTGGGDGFDGRDDQREAYERYMRGNVSADKERFDELRKKGTRDDFNPERPATEVEALGTPRATAHVVRLYEAWTLEGVTREVAMQRAADFLAGFSSVQNIRKVLAELESKPIRDVYPLEVLMKMLDERPQLLPGVRAGKIIENGAELLDGSRVLAGYPTTVHLPTDVRLKSFALLGGGRPGYEFAPALEEGRYTLLVDTPGEWTFAVLAAPLQQLGRIQRETQEAILELFAVHVHAMGKKGEPLTAEEWRAQRALEEDPFADEGNGDGDRDDDDDDEDSGVSGDGRPRAEVALAPNLPVQIRAQLERIARDEDGPGLGAAATTYSWDASFYRPGAPMDGEPILHLVVQRAGPFDVVWIKAREALAQKQKEFEPGRATVTPEDFTAALRRARVR